ncbi:MAG: glutamate-5-semialdehyde dehydrogenase [Anaerolineaceae bacterium]|jgi:glutamate-5-semialdehyde dehydrogenase|nr:glutamate-5-semialdehyde dehydrogenase [Anaerolineaceae bacterium]
MKIVSNTGAYMIKELCIKAKEASGKLALLSTEKKKAALVSMADLLLEHGDEIIAANEVDVQEARKAGLSDSMLDRLALNETRIAGIVADLRAVANLPDPVGETCEEKETADGLHVFKQRVPLGVLAVIYEARPNVTVDITGLALKSGNAVILRGGSETLNTNRALIRIIRQAMHEAGLPENGVQFIDSPDRALIGELLKMYDYVDMLIPRGGAALHKFCRENSMIPVITGGIGICHLYVDQTADLAASVKVIQNAKVQRPSVCNALDTVLLHRAIAANVLPMIVNTLSEDGVIFHLDEKAIAFYGGETETVQQASPGDFDKEWLSLNLGIKIVADLDEAMEHIRIHGTAHSDGILTENQEHAQRFMNEVDSACVYVNSSTRFTDGSKLGLGAEVAISTQKLHARGPMALYELTTYKWVIQGNYHVRQ